MAGFTEREVQHHRPEHAVEGGGGSPGGAGLSPAWIAAIIAAALVVAVLGRVVKHRLDRGRIEAYARDRGWDLLECRWNLFGPGWFGSRSERIYAVRYRDGDGRTHAAFAKTSALAGVYLTEDRVEP